MKITLLQSFLENPSGFSNEQIMEMKESPLKIENFQIKDVPEETLLENIKKFFLLQGYSVSEASLSGVFEIKHENKLIAYFVFNSFEPSDLAFITVIPLTPTIIRPERKDEDSFGSVMGQHWRKEY